jgi:hypothetical protein
MKSAGRACGRGGFLWVIEGEEFGILGENVMGRA